MVNWSHDEIEKLKQQIISAAQEEAKQITDRAKTEAEAESVIITKESEENLARIRKNIDSLSDTIADKIVKMTVKGSVTSLSGENASRMKVFQIQQNRFRNYFD